jgi:hypothetical protein
VIVLDRETLRDKLDRLLPDQDPVKVLLVRGSTKSGKSHGRYIFERAAYDAGAQPLYLCDGIVATVQDVFDQLFIALEAESSVPPRESSADAWYKAVCVALQKQAALKKKALWIAVDDLGPTQDGAPLLDPEIKLFFDQFALNMLNPAFRKWFRLMLIHYPDGPTPTRWKRDFWIEDRTSENDIGQQEVMDLLKSWSTTHNIRTVEDELKGLAADIIQKADTATPGPASAPRLEMIHNALLDTIVELKKRKQ